MAPQLFFVYILQCADQTFYIGSTKNIQKRIHQHNFLKSGAHYTKIRRPVALVYQESCESYAIARRREAELKKLSRTKKEALVQLYR